MVLVSTTQVIVMSDAHGTCVSRRYASCFTLCSAVVGADCSTAEKKIIQVIHHSELSGCPISSLATTQSTPLKLTCT